MQLFTAIAVDLELVNEICFGNPFVFFKKAGIKIKIGLHTDIDLLLIKENSKRENNNSKKI